MKSTSTTLLIMLALLWLFPVGAVAQDNPSATAASASVVKSKGGVSSPTASPTDLARSALAAHGADNFRNLKSLILKGSGTAFSPLSTQAAPIDFTIIYTKDRVRLDMKAPFGMIHLINDGEQFYTLFAGQRGTFGLAPPGKYGLGLLTKFDQPGATVTALSSEKNEAAFRITDQAGRATDFYVDPSTNLVAHYEYKYNNYTNSWEQKDFRKVEGVLVPHKLTMKLGSRVGDYYAEFKVKEVQVNPKVSDTVFAPPSTPAPIE